MPRFYLFKILLLVVTATTCAALEIQPDSPFAGGFCKNPLINFTYEIYESWAPEFTHSESAGDNGYLSYSNLQFDAVEASNDQPRYGIHLVTRSRDSDCCLIFMKPTIEDRDEQLDTNQIPGNVFIDVGLQGCIYISFPVVMNFVMAFSCGTSDCICYAFGKQALFKRQAPTVKNLLIADREMKSKNIDHLRSESFPSREFALTVLAKYPMKRGDCASSNSNWFAKDWGFCHLSQGDIFSSTGLQEAVSPSLSHEAGSSTCSIVSLTGLTSGVAISTSKNTTTATTYGDTLFVNTGTECPVGLKETEAVKVGLAKAVSKIASKEISSGTTVTVTEALGNLPDITTFISFTISYTCYSPNINCVNISDSGAFTISCFPNLNANGQPQKEANIVYIQ